MRLIEGLELNSMQPIIDAAISQAKRSVCQNSQRGATAFNQEGILGVGKNGPPVVPQRRGELPRTISCIPPICWKDCRDYAVHAEERALLDALLNKKELVGASIFHIKVKNGLVVPSDNLSCLRCSAKVLELGLKEFILFQTQGYLAYEAYEFHCATIDFLRRNPR